MRTKSKTVLAVLAVALAVTATSASAASAFTEFTGKEGIGTKITLNPDSKMTVEFNPGFAMICSSLSGSGVVTSKTLLTISSSTFGGCTLSGLAVKNVDTCNYKYGINGKVSIEGTNCAKFEIPAYGCVITINGNQSGLNSVEYAPYASFESEVRLSLGGVHFSTTTGKHCGMEQESVSGNVTYKGTSLLKGVTER